MFPSLIHPGLHLSNAGGILQVHMEASAEGERGDTVPSMADSGEDVEEVVLVQKCANFNQGLFR
jgi:hypothetical protein